jgi:hypothetical protein
MVNDMVQTQIIVIQRLDISYIKSNAIIILDREWSEKYKKNECPPKLKLSEEIMKEESGMYYVD